jgi:hypothetical protein
MRFLPVVEEKLGISLCTVQVRWCRQAKYDEGGQVQAEEHNLVSGGLLSMISPVSDTFK